MVPLREAKPSKRAVAGVVKRVAEQLGNTPAVCRKSYIHPRVLSSCLDGSLKPTLDDDRGEHTRARGLRRRRGGDAPAGGMDRCGQADRRHARKPAAGEGAGELTEVMHGVRGIRQT